MLERSEQRAVSKNRGNWARVGNQDGSRRDICLSGTRARRSDSGEPSPKPLLGLVRRADACGTWRSVLAPVRCQGLLRRWSHPRDRAGGAQPWAASSRDNGKTKERAGVIGVPAEGSRTKRRSHFQRHRESPLRWRSTPILRLREHAGLRKRRWGPFTRAL